MLCNLNYIYINDNDEFQLKSAYKYFMSIIANLSISI